MHYRELSHPCAEGSSQGRQAPLEGASLDIADHPVNAVNCLVVTLPLIDTRVASRRDDPAKPRRDEDQTLLRRNRMSKTIRMMRTIVPIPMYMAFPLVAVKAGAQIRSMPAGPRTAHSRPVQTHRRTRLGKRGAKGTRTPDLSHACDSAHRPAVPDVAMGAVNLQRLWLDVARCRRLCRCASGSHASAAALRSSTDRSRTLPHSRAASSSSARASAIRPSLTSSSPRTLGSR
jgi:hypothetical protein